MEALVQLRGEVNQSGSVRDTLSMLNLGRVNHCVFVPERDSYRGMITKVNDWVAHGEPSVETVEQLVATRAEPVRESGAGDAEASDREEPVDDAWVAEYTDYDDVAALAEALVNDETTLQEQGLSPTLRLHPPRGGHDGIKHPTKEGGALGKQTTEEIDDLLSTMR